MLPDLQTLLEPRPRKFRHIARHLGPYINLPDDTDVLHSEEELFEDLTSSRGSSRFLGLFSARGIRFGLKQFGILRALRQAGLPESRVLLDTRDPFRHRVRIVHPQGSQNLVSAEVVVRRGKLSLPPWVADMPPALEFLIVEWLLLQHPMKRFSRHRPQLPGQDFPGLGISRLIFELLYWTGRRLRVSGIVLVPNYLHTALFYGRQCLFLDPVRQGELYALSDLVKRRTRLDQLSWACAEGHLLRKPDNEPYLWVPAPMGMPVAQELKDFFHSPRYIRTLTESRRDFQVKIQPGYRKSYQRDWTAA